MSADGVSFQGMEEIISIPVRRLHNYLYCPRLMYFQFIENVFVQNSDVLEGDLVHAAVDTPSAGDFLSDPADFPGKVIRSLALENPVLGIHGVIDLMKQTEDGSWKIYDYKRGSPLHSNQGTAMAKESDSVQICAYAMLAENSGRIISSLEIYYAETKQLVPVPFTDSLREKVLDTIQRVRNAIHLPMPEPLISDVRCLYCSLYPVCLPDESLYWKKQTKRNSACRPPMLEIPKEETIIIQSPDIFLSKKGDTLISSRKGEKISVHPVNRIRSIMIYGVPQFSTQVLQTCLERDIAVSFFSPAGKFLGRLDTLSISGLDSRHGQYRTAENEALSLKIASRMISAKIQNQRTLLLRNANPRPDILISEMDSLKKAVCSVQTRDALQGLEGRAAALYFEGFPQMISNPDFLGLFHGRNRRPPRDPVNALLSLGYSVLSSEIAGICASAGLDPACGLLHVPRFGRPALALDLMEEFRPLIVDSVVLSLINRAEIALSDFFSASTGCALQRSGHKAFWCAYSRRMNEEVSHPVFHYRMSYRRMLEIQAAQLWRIFRGDAGPYHPMTTR